MTLDESSVSMTRNDVVAAAARIAPYAHRTPVLTSRSINEIVGAELYFKAENLQRVGAFKFRGACNAVFSLTDAQASHGVITHSSGNHAAALALAAKLRGIEALIVMPENAPDIKKAAVAGYGAKIEFCAANEAAREAAVAHAQTLHPFELIHPFNDCRIISGQGTAALELLTDEPELDAIMTPVGGGGLLSGTALAASESSVKVLGTEPANADDAARSFAADKVIPITAPDTIADGLRTSLGDLTFAIIRSQVEQIMTVSEDAIVHAMKLLWERMNIIVEPSAAVPLAALMEQGMPDGIAKAGIILSGGNVDLGHLPWQD
jgi:threonine dehydratase